MVSTNCAVLGSYSPFSVLFPLRRRCRRRRGCRPVRGMPRPRRGAPSRENPVFCDRQPAHLGKPGPAQPTSWNDHAPASADDVMDGRQVSPAVSERAGTGGRRGDAIGFGGVGEGRGSGFPGSVSSAVWAAMSSGGFSLVAGGWGSTSCSAGIGERARPNADHLAVYACLSLGTRKRAFFPSAFAPWPPRLRDLLRGQTSQAGPDVSRPSPHRSPVRHAPRRHPF